MHTDDRVDTNMTASELLERLSEGWQPEKAGMIDELVRMWWRKTQAVADNIVIEQNMASFTQALDSVKLLNFNNLRVLVAGGEIDRRELLNWSQKFFTSSAASQLLVLTTSDIAFVEADAIFPAEQDHLVIEPEAVASILEAADGLEALKSVARRRLSRYRLNPFGILRVPGSNMFAGRQHELGLLQHADSSFALAGPGRIGKTSLVQHFRRLLRRANRPRYARVVYIDYLAFPPESIKDEREVCRYLTFKINDTKWGHDQVPEKLEGFLRTEGKARGGLIELILDEVDLVCNTRTFDLLAEAAKNEACRLILCGKFNLYEAMNSPNHVFCKRLRILPLSPLTVVDARLLFLQPLRDLGFSMTPSVEEQIFSNVYSDTGGYPHLIQFYGDSIVSAAMRVRQDELTLDLYEAVANSDETDQVLASQLLGIENPVEQLLGLALVHRPNEPIGESTIRQIAGAEGIKLDEPEAERLCRKLYINNVLSRQGEYYQIANRGLSRAVRRRGYLARRLADLRKEFSRRR